MKKLKLVLSLTVLTSIAFFFQNCGQQEFSTSNSQLAPPEVIVPIPNPEPIERIQPYNNCDMFQDYGQSYRQGSSDGTIISGMMPRIEENYVFGMYNVTNSSHGNGKRYKTSMKVFIPQGNKPVNLFLYAYEPTVWEFSGSVDRLANVQIQGYHCQTAKNLMAKTDVVVAYYAEGGLNANLRLRSPSGRTEDILDLAVKYFARNDAVLTKGQYVYSGSDLKSVFVAKP